MGIRSCGERAAAAFPCRTNCYCVDLNRCDGFRDSGGRDTQRGCLLKWCRRTKHIRDTFAKDQKREDVLLHVAAAEIRVVHRNAGERKRGTCRDGHFIPHSIA